MSALKFQLVKNKDNLKELTLDVNVNNWQGFRVILNTFKRSVNEYLTELVEQEKPIICEENLSEHDSSIEEVSEDDSSEDEKCSKRVANSPNGFEKSKVPKI